MVAILRRFLPSLCLCLLFSSLLPVTVHAGWNDWLNLIKQTLESDADTVNLTEADVIAALRQALNEGSRLATSQLGKMNGFYSDPRVKIPLPDQLQSVAAALRTLKQEKLADDFVLSLNRAAEQAVPGATAILYSIVQSMTVEDAFGILRGNDMAATNYLRQKGSEELKLQFQPIVARATDSVGVTREYKALIERIGMLSAVTDIAALDIDAYVTEKAVDGMFALIASEEKKIRNDPAARTTELLQQVFNSR